MPTNNAAARQHEPLSLESTRMRWTRARRSSGLPDRNPDAAFLAAADVAAAGAKNRAAAFYLFCKVP
jgi:hypothetical protein